MVILADSVYISANLTRIQLDFLKLLDEQEIRLFRFSDIEMRLAQSYENLNEILENLVHKELLVRLEKGKFCRYGLKDEFVIGTFVVEDSAVSYWSALNLHGLAGQFPETVFIQTPHRKNDKTILGTAYKFIKIAAYKRTGITWNSYGNLCYPLTDIEKTIVDCFDQPQYSGGYSGLIKAFKKARMTPEKLIIYCNTIDNIAVTKRIGFLAGLFHPETLDSFIEFARKKVNRKYNVFDPQGPDEGEFVAEWKLRMNISKQRLIEIV